jgi:membrane protein
VRAPERIQLIKQLLLELADSRLENGAAALAFYTTLAIFPTAIFGLSLLPYLPIPDLHQAIFELLGEVMPREAAEMFRGTVQTVLGTRHAGLLSFSLLFGIWSASSGVLAVMEQLDVARRADHQRGALRARALAFLLLFPLSVLVVLAFGLIIFGGYLQDWLAQSLGTSALLLSVFATFRWLVVVLALSIAIALLYWIGPSHRPRFRWLSTGCVFATLGLMLASFGFRYYVAHFASYDAIYGSIGAMIVLLMWLFVAGWVFLIGAALDAFLVKQLGAQRSLTNT